MEWALASKHIHDDNQQLWLTKHSAQARNTFASMACFMSDCTCHAWAQLGGGHGGCVPHFFRGWGYNMLCLPPYFSLLVLYSERFQK